MLYPKMLPCNTIKSVGSNVARHTSWHRTGAGACRPWDTCTSRVAGWLGRARPPGSARHYSSASTSRDIHSRHSPLPAAPRSQLALPQQRLSLQPVDSNPPRARRATLQGRCGGAMGADGGGAADAPPGDAPGELQADAFKRLYPDQYFQRFVEQGIRPDGRTLTVCRAASIGVHSVAQADGSALVKLGSTSVLAGEVGCPDTHSPPQPRPRPRLRPPHPHRRLLCAAQACAWRWPCRLQPDPTWACWQCLSRPPPCPAPTGGPGGAAERPT